jgi:hypothetical protein
MATSNGNDSGKTSAHAIERVPSSQDQFNHGYEPKTEEERQLDRRVNLKLDISVVLILAIDFILCGIDKT